MKKAFIISIVVVLLMSMLSVGIGVISSVVVALPPCSAGIPLSPVPTDAAYPVPVDVDLDWADCANTSYYHVYFGNSSPPVYLGNTTTNTSSWPLTPLTYNTTYYWRVDAFNGSTCYTNGSEWRFTTECGNPGMPGNASPSNSATNVSVNTDLDWDDSSDASSYDVYFGTSSNPTTLNGTVTTSNRTMPTLSFNTTYYWKVVAKNGCGHSTEGPIWSFTTGCTTPDKPVDPLIPLNGSAPISVEVDLDWADCANASSYDVYFGTSSNPTTLNGTVTTSNRTMPTLSFNTTYYWKVVAVNSCGNNSSGPVWNFSTGCPNPLMPTNPSPANSSHWIPVSTILNWDDSQYASSYRVYFGNNSSSLALIGSPIASSITPPALIVNTTYYWKVVANNSCGSTNGSVWNFTTDCAIPSKPQTPSPANLSTEVSVEADLAWANCSNASSYQVYFGTASTPSILVGNPTVSSWTLSTLTSNTTYYWKVVAINACGTNNSSDIWHFKTQCAVPSTPGSPSPADALSGVSVNPDLDWSDCSYATYYQVYCDTNSSPSTLKGSPNASSLTLSSLSINTTYYWKVVAKNGCGSTNGSIWSFTTAGCAAPGTPVSPSPADVSTGIFIDADLDWGNSSDATYYQVYFGTNSTPSTLVGSPNASGWTLPALSVNTTYYWKVVAKNGCGSSNGSIWSFTTGVCAAPSKPQTPSPINGSANISSNIMLDWDDCANASSYDVYFNTSANPSYYASTNNSSYQLSQLAYSTKFYWKVVAKNSCSVNNSSDLWDFTTGAAAPMLTISFDIGGTNASWNTSSAGVIQQVVNITSADETINLYIPAGTIALNSEGEPLDELNMSSTTVYPAASGDRRVIAAFDFDPDGATFNPGIVVTLSYTHDDIPAGVNESSLIVALYNESSGGWEYINGDVDPDANTITFTVHHFTTFTIQTPPIKNESAGLGTWVIIVIVFVAAIILGLVGGLYIKYKRVYGSLYYEDEGDEDDKYDEYRKYSEDEGDFKF